jgi:hypothetical protein
MGEQTNIRTLPVRHIPDRPGDGGGNDGDNGDMDRFAAIEHRLSRVEVSLEYIGKEVSQVKWWVIGQIVALFVAVVGTGVAIQQMTVSTFQGAAQVARDSAPVAAPQPQLPQPIIINVPSSAPAVAPAIKP